MIAEERKRRWRGLHLRGVVQLHFSARGLRRLQSGDDFLQRVIDLRRGDAARTLRLHLERDIQHLVHTLARQRRREQERHETEIRDLLGGVLPELD